MQPGDQLLLTCTRQELSPAQLVQAARLSRSSEIDWPALQGTAESHGVAPLVYTHLVRHSEEWEVPQAVLTMGKARASRNALEKKQRADHLADALSYFSNMGLRAMLIKGAAMDLLVYEQPWYTISSDTDIILSVTLEDLPTDQLREIMAYLHLKKIEYDFYRHHDVDMNGALPINFEEIWQDSQAGDYRGQGIVLMSPEDMLISLCINSCRKRYFRLKSMLDIAEAVTRLPGLNWDRLLSKARRYDCQSIVYCALQVTRAMIGCPVPEQVLPDLSVPGWRARTIDGLIEAFSRRIPLDSFNFPSRDLLGRAIHPALLLTYATYRPYQVVRKVNEVLHAWRVRRKVVI